jgi:integrase
VAYAAGLRISELAAADLGSLDLRRGEIRVIGKGRKERIGLLGRPAIAALEAYLDLGRPLLVDRRPPGWAVADRRLPEPCWWAAGACAACVPARSAVPRRRSPRGRLAAHAAALVRDTSPRRWRRPACRPGAARSREPGDDPDLYARLAGAPRSRLSRSPSSGPARDDDVTGAT